MDDLRNRFTNIKEADGARHSLIEDLFQRIDDMEKTMDRSAFVLVLIDGDCMNFQDDFIKSGISGGEEAAKLLQRSVFEYLRYEKSFKHDHKILIKVYANLRGLSKTYAASSILPNTTGLDNFVLGFNKAHPLCDFTDAGNHKGAADTKIKEILNLYMHNVHCKQIVLGASADNGYASFLSSCSIDIDISARVRLLMGPPFSFEFKQILPKFKWTEFKDVFRSELISTETIRQPSWRKTQAVELLSQPETSRPVPRLTRATLRELVKNDVDATTQPVQSGEALSPAPSTSAPLSSVSSQENIKSNNKGRLRTVQDHLATASPVGPSPLSHNDGWPDETQVYNALIKATNEVLEESPKAVDFGSVKHKAAQKLRVTSTFWGKSEEDYWFQRTKCMIKKTVENWVQRTDNPPPKNATWMLRYFPSGQSPSFVMNDPSSSDWRTQDPRDTWWNPRLKPQHSVARHWEVSSQVSSFSREST